MAVIIGCACFFAGILTNSYIRRRARRVRRENALGKMTWREYHMKNNDVYRENCRRYGG